MKAQDNVWVLPKLLNLRLTLGKTENGEQEANQLMGVSNNFRYLNLLFASSFIWI